MITVIYITGYGRSGSTLLTILLANQPGIVGCGEVNKLWHQVWPNDEYCGCGLRASACSFWKKVRSHCLADPAAGAFEECLARHQRYQGIRRWRQVRRALRGPDSDFDAYASQVGALYRAISGTAGDSIIVDSSKCPTWGLMLQNVPGIDVRYIHLTRDVRSVFASLLTPYETDSARGYQKAWTPPSAIRTALAWSMHNRVAEKTSRGSHYHQRLAYEDLVEDPERAVQDMATHLDLDLGGALKKVCRRAPLQSGCLIAGNAMRMAPTVTLREGPATYPEIPVRDHRILSLLARRALRRYGYPT